LQLIQLTIKSNFSRRDSLRLASQDNRCSSAATDDHEPPRVGGGLENHTKELAMAKSAEADSTATRPLFKTISAAEAEVELGPLAPLVGTWQGSGGWNLIAVPAPPAANCRPAFTLLVAQIIDTITFKPILALVPNRGGLVGVMQIPGLYYEQTVYQQTDPTQLMHIENGMWLLMPQPQPPMPGTGKPPVSWVPQVARMSTIPHGNSLVAVGEVTESDRGPDMPTNSARPDIGQVNFLPGYTDPYLFGVEINTADMNQVLRDANKGVQFRHTVALDVSTANGGGIANVPFVQANADARNFKCTFWLETLQGDLLPRRLQYSQTVDLFFISRPDGEGLIKWPHVTVSTLTKQA
jgi:hypothetical protein